MSYEEVYREARTEAVRSFWHKLAILGLALLGYAGIAALGVAKERHEQHHKDRWQLTQTALNGFRDTAAKIAPATNGADLAVLQAVAADFQSTSPATGALDSREALVTAIGKLADAHIWRNAATQIDEMKRALDPNANGAKTENGAKTGVTAPLESPAASAAKPLNEREVERYLNQITAAEALARARVASVHALIDATATQIDPAHEDAPVLASMFDEKKPMYVFYEICWFTMLSLAVLASAWLLMLFFTVLPFTSAEGYWTKRIGDILEKFGAGAIAASATVPIVSAALVAATVFAGTGFATVPGGYARNVTTTIVTTQPTIERTTTTEITTTDPAQLTAAQLNAALATLQENVGTKVDTSELKVRADVKKAKDSLHAHLDDADDVQSDIGESAAGAADDAHLTADRTRLVPDIHEATAKISATIGKPKKPDATLASRIDGTADDVDAGTTQFHDARTDLDKRAKTENAVRTATFARATMVDERNFFWRAVGRTVYRANDAAVHELAARLEVPLEPDGRPLPKLATTEANLIRALATAIAEPKAVNSSDFRAILRKASTDTSVQQLIDDHWREILHVCALPRE
jgi:hypothetical protein